MLGETVFIFRMDIRPGVDHNLQFIRRDGFPPDGTKAIHIMSCSWAGRSSRLYHYTPK